MLKCKECKKKPVFIKKRQLCRLCYHKLRREEGGLPVNAPKCPKVLAKRQYIAEMAFIKAYFNHMNWVHQPANFRLNGCNYAPDFYDGERNVFIEVSGTRQAYHDNKNKYEMFFKAFPKLSLEVRKSNGELLTSTKGRFEWK